MITGDPLMDRLSVRTCRFESQRAVAVHDDLLAGTQRWLLRERRLARLRLVDDDCWLVDPDDLGADGTVDALVLHPDNPQLRSGGAYP